MKRDRKEYARAYYLKNRDRLIIKSREYWEANGDLILKQKRSDYARCKQIVRVYGITCEDYDRMFKEQNGVCAICQCKRIKGCSTRNGYLFVDHDHVTGKVRGLLCNACNTHLSTFELYEKEMRGYLNSSGQQSLRFVLEQSGAVPLDL